ncbi:type II toxin-antitoxin system Phd/YefM family antitoxin [Streptomyces hydrogenans]|uniref:type II toxin-antitoxin system Phd/YefM family antitoxin n=1 Tax=Streptomyces hydrogenans TaxID=1873719 RepID=UPI003442B423
MEPRVYTTIDLRKGMGEILDRVRIAGEPAVVTRKGRALAYLVPAEWFEHYQQLVEQASGTAGGRDVA